MKLSLIEKQSAPARIKKAALSAPRKESSLGRDIGLLFLRLATGGLLAGHGSQKLFGWFGGSGLKGTAGWLESMGMKPGTPWATAATASEFGGGTLTAMGLLYPLGPLATMGSMITATSKVHWGKPIWVTQGGAELPVTDLAVAATLALGGPGRFSLDRLLGIRLPRWLVVSAALAEAALVIIGIISSRQETAPEMAVDQQARTPVAAARASGTL